jgi:L-malate glycosyltransferase
VSGAERSLLELLAGLPYDVDPVVACPPGELADQVRWLAVPCLELPETVVSFRLHPWHTPRGISQIVAAATYMRRLADVFAIDLVHANSVRSGLVAGLASTAGGPPVIVHVRDCMPRGRTADLVRRFLRSRVAAVFANSQYTAGNFASSVPVPPVRVIYNAVDLERFDPERIDRAAAREELGLDPDELVLGVVSQITPWKAQDDAIRVVSLLREQGVDVRLLIVGDAKFTVGSIRYDNESFERSLHTLAQGLALDGYVRFLGERSDVPQILRALDLVLVPSWEEPFGRILIEAMAMQTPVLATKVGGPPEVIQNGEGVLLPPREPERWADEAAALLLDRDRRAAMGEKGRAVVAARFTRAAHVESVVDGYRDLLERTRSRAEA